MTHTYQIDGMHCGSCVTKVKDELLKLGGITAAEVQLQDPQATISMSKHFNMATLQHAISKAGKFTIHEFKPGKEAVGQQYIENKSWLSTYKPLLIVFGYISGLTLLMAWSSSGVDWMIWMNNFMGGFFITFSFFKLLDVKSFADSYSNYDLLAKKVRGYGFVYPFIELALGVAYITNWQAFYTNLVTMVVMGFSSLGVIESIANKRKIRCACLGAVFNVPVSSITLIEDLLMVAMALFSLIYLL